MARKKQGKRNPAAFAALVLFLLGGSLAVFIYLKVQNLWNHGLKGIDISHHQGKINWESVRKEGVHFAFIKATEGTTLEDEDFRYNWKESAKNRIIRGAYHFFIPSLDAEKQARNFLRKVKPQSGDLAPVLDLEITGGQSAGKIAEGALKWMKMVEAETGMKPILYTLPRFANDYLAQRLCDYPLWVVDLGSREPGLPRGWKTWTFWQYSHKGRIPGIAETVDLDYFNGTIDDLEALRKK